MGEAAATAGPRAAPANPPAPRDATPRAEDLEATNPDQ